MATSIALDGRRTEGKKTKPISRVEAPRHDCLDEEEEGDEAKLLPRFDLLREVSVGGGERRRLGLGFGLIRKTGRKK